jgi:hypothetical protein
MAWGFAVPPVANAVLVTITSTNPATGNLPNHISFTFILTPEMGESITSFDATFISSSTMNQINPGASMAETVWEDFNDFFPMGFTAADDSQFEFHTDEWAETPNSLSNEEESSPGLLEAVASGPVIPWTSTMNLAHVVVPNDATVDWIITTVVNNNPMTETTQFGSVPEASQLVVGVVATVSVSGIYLFRRFSKRRTAA